MDGVQFNALSNKDKDLFIHHKIYSLNESIFDIKPLRRNFKAGTIKTEDGQYDNALNIAFNFNDGLNLNDEVIDYLIKKSSHQYHKKNYWLPILWAWRNNKSKNFNLSQQQLDYMFLRSNFILCNKSIIEYNKNSPTPLVVAVMAQVSGRINLHILQWQYLIKISDIEHTKKMLESWFNDKPEQSLPFLDSIMEKCLLTHL